jgi:hypothetical protein
MRRWGIAVAYALGCAMVVAAPWPAAADILVTISKSSQRMSVLVDGSARYNWVVSTGTKRHTTPTGAYKPQWLARKWRSRQYRNAPMPHSIFFYKGYAIHGTTEIKRLGKVASHGCVRLHPDNAATLYSLVQKQMANTRVVVSDDVIEAPGQAPKQKKPSRHVAENDVSEEPADSAIKLKTAASAPRHSGIKVETVALAQDPDAAEDQPPAHKAYARARVHDIAKPPRPARTAKVAHASKVGFHW